MKFLLLFMFVAVALATEEDESLQQYMVERTSKLYNISKAESVECIKKTGVKYEEMSYLQNSLDLPDSEITDNQSLKRASCLFVCAAQKQGSMVGREINLTRFYEVIQEGGAPENIQILMREAARVCKDEVAARNEPDECMVGYRFYRCYHRTLVLPENK